MPLTTPVTVKFGETEDPILDKFVKDNLQALRDSLNELHTQKVPEWRRLYKGIPAEETREFPWPNASNVVIQLIGENVDILKAFIIGSIYEIMPLFPTKLVGMWEDSEKGEEQRSSVEAFMDLMGLEPDELDLYRVESLAANDMAQFGTVCIKQPWETLKETKVVAVNSEDRNKTDVEFTKYDGPRPEKLAIEDWGATPTASTWSKAPFKYHKYTLFKQDIERKRFEGSFDEAAADKILKSPDREGVDSLTEEKLRNEKINSKSCLAEWDFYECWFWYFHNNTTYHIIFTYHPASNTRMRAVFNFYTDNDEPFEIGRLGFTNDGLYGYGFSEMLKYYQEEVTTGHNQRVDNRTLANTSIVLAGSNSRLDAGFGLYPMAVLPFDPDDFRVQQLGSNYPSSVQEEGLTIELAKARSGVEAGLQGAGGGTTNPKKGNYSAMGTFAVMQQGNRRVNINVTDFRYLHLKLGRKALRQYAEFGIGQRAGYFGKQAEYINKALENIKKKRLDLPIRAATASVNSELEKQNGMLFTQVMQRHYSAISQILQGLQNPSMPEDLKEYLIGSIGGMAALMTRLLRAFGYDDVSRLQPELKLLEKVRSQQSGQRNNQQSEGEGSSNGQPGISSIQEAGGQQGAIQGAQGLPALQGAGGVPPTMPM